MQGKEVCRETNWEGECKTGSTKMLIRANLKAEGCRDIQWLLRCFEGGVAESGNSKSQWCTAICTNFKLLGGTVAQCR